MSGYFKQKLDAVFAQDNYEQIMSFIEINHLWNDVETQVALIVRGNAEEIEVMKARVFMILLEAGAVSADELTDRHKAVMKRFETMINTNDKARRLRNW